MKSFTPDIDFPIEITPEEKEAGFSLQTINPDAGIAERAVILTLGEKHRIVKMRDMVTQEVVYVHQMKRLHCGHLSFSEGAFYTNMKIAVGFARLTKDFEI